MAGRKILFFTLAFIGLFGLIHSQTAGAADVFRETFDAREDGASMNGVDSWSVSAGSASNALVKSNSTFSGEGKALKVTNALKPVEISRSVSYGGLTPAWIEMTLKPGLGNEPGTMPAGGIGAVCFDKSGKVLVADGTAWVDTGKTFDTDTWYKVLLKVNFNDHTYDAYVWPAATDKVPFVADKQSLKFINTSINAVNKIGFEGVYSETLPGDTYVDEVTVHFVQSVEFISAPQNLVKGNPSNAITLQLQDSNAEPQTAWENLTFDLSSSSEGGQFSLSKVEWDPMTQVVIPKDSQQVTFYYKDSQEGKPVVRASGTPDRGWEEAIQEMNVAAEGQYFEVTATSPQVAGQTFNLQITAKNSNGDPDTFYGGSVDVFVTYVDPESGTRLVTPDSASGFQEGVLDIPVSYSDCGIVQITVEDQQDSSKKGSSGQIVFTPASFSVTADALAHYVSKPFDLTVTSLAEGGEVTPNYKGPAVLEVLGVNPKDISGGNLSPTQLETANFSGGEALASLVYDRWGTIQIEAHDSALPTRKGTSPELTFRPTSISVKVTPPPTGRDFFYTGESIEAVLTVEDANKQPVKNFEGSVAITVSPEFPVPSGATFQAIDTGKKSVLLSPESAGTYTLTIASETYGLTASSEPFKVKQATIEVISSVAPVGTTEVQIQLVDEKGLRITSENTLIITLGLSEEDPNNSVFLSSPGKPILFYNGLAKVALSNTQAETVTISPQATAGFKVKGGTVTFGRVGQAGIGVLMLLESKDDVERPEGDKNETKKS